MRVWRLMAYYDAEGTTYSAAAGLSGSGASPYTPDFSGRLTGLRVLNGISAATSLGTNQVFRLTCSSWTPNTIEIATTGNGLATAPAQPRPVVDYDIDEPVVAGVPIAIEGKNMTAGSPVTVETMILGLFEVK
jgi:hypothetical protein